MRNRLIVLVSVVLVLALCIAANQSLKHENDRYHQHLAQANLLPATDTSHINVSTQGSQVIQPEGFVSHLPLITIDTHGQEMAGAELTDYSRTRVTTRFYNSDGSGLETNTLDRKPDLESLADVRYRGKSSRDFDKKGYSIHLVEPDGEENRKRVFGMAKHDEWVLHGPFMDKTLVRNYLMYNLSGQIMDWAPNVRFCELFVDNIYQGVYLMVEQIAISEERINLRKSQPKEEFTSYLVEIVSSNRVRPDVSVILDNFTRYAGILPDIRLFEVEYPSSSNITEAQAQYIDNDLSAFERLLYSNDYDDDVSGYRDKINMRSFVDYVILNEFSMNYDAGNYSTFIFRDAKGDFDICVWDFNNAFDNYVRTVDSTDFYFRSRIWFEMFLKDEVFVDRLVSRYRELRTTWLSDEYLMEYIDSTIAYLGPAIERNYTVWGYTFAREEGLLYPSIRNLTSFDEAVAQLKAVILERGAFMDENIESYYQFCHPSKVKPYNP